MFCGRKLNGRVRRGLLVGGQISSGGGRGRKVAILLWPVRVVSHTAAPYPVIMRILNAECEKKVQAPRPILGLKSAVSAPMRAAKSVQMGD